VVCFEKVESEGRFRTVEGRGVPAHTKELPVVLVGHIACTAFAESGLYFMPTVDVDDGELMARRVHRACIAAMSEIADVPK